MVRRPPNKTLLLGIEAVHLARSGKSDAPRHTTSANDADRRLNRREVVFIHLAAQKEIYTRDDQ